MIFTKEKLSLLNAAMTIFDDRPLNQIKIISPNKVIANYHTQTKKAEFNWNEKLKMWQLAD